MTKEEILSKASGYAEVELYKHHEIEIIRVSEAYEAMDEYAEQECIGFMLWYATKMATFIEYIQDIRPRVESHEMEEKIEEFEGKPIKYLYQLYLKSKQLP